MAVHVLDERVNQILTAVNKLEKKLDIHQLKVESSMQAIHSVEIRLELLERDVAASNASYRSLVGVVEEHIRSDTKIEDWAAMTAGRTSGKVLLWIGLTIFGVVMGRWGTLIADALFK